MKTINVKGPIISNGEKWIYEWFGEDSTCPNDVIKELPEDRTPVTVIINSGGGYVTCGNEIYTALKTYEGPVTVTIIEAASAASVIAMAGDIVKITPPGQIMIHNASMRTAGDYREMNKVSEILQKRNRSIASTYQLKTGLEEEELLRLMDQETWMTAQEARQYGFVDEILFQDDMPKMIASGKDMLPVNIIKKMQESKQGSAAAQGQSAHKGIIEPEALEAAVRKVMASLQETPENKKPVSPMTRFLF